ncbi:glycerophosphodiester phosphodiesterase family protein [Nesterenkonia alba]|uniref:glycerophosphodiester phosphodiesterase family protein n=1 Tax=Nesterenkonia alba TaxID=515814 RepID=UPI0003B32512|nr:glycerophosphodiester phosphodiesterase family protein [Nesterenkonia alba]
MTFPNAEVQQAQPLSRVPAPVLHTIPEDLDAVGVPRRLTGIRRRAAVFAHRGSSGLFPEHTRAAYLRAIEEGADGLEIDVHLTRDGEVVCFHDPTLERTSDGSGPLADLTLAQLRRLDVSSWKTPKLPGEYGARHEQLMTLQDTLELLGQAGRDMRLAVEMKHPSPYGHRLEERVLQILLTFGWDPETSLIPAGEHRVEVSFMSFAPGSVLHLAEMVPAEKLCALFGTVTEAHVAKRLEHLRFSAAVKPVVAAVMRGAMKDSEALVWNRTAGLAGPAISYVRSHKAEVKAWLARGSRLRVWTVDEPDDVALLLSLGVQEITTNYPHRTLEAVTV